MRPLDNIKDPRSCDPRCRKHAGAVSDRTRNECKRRLDRESAWRTPKDQPPSAQEAATHGSSSRRQPYPFDFAARVMSSMAQPRERLTPHRELDDDQDDPTMPTWGAPLPGDPSGSIRYGEQNNAEKSDDDMASGAGLFNASVYDYPVSRSHTVTPVEPSEYDYSPTEYDYNSADDADIDTDTDMGIDDPFLIRMSTVPPSRPPTPPQPEPPEPIQGEQPNPRVEEQMPQDPQVNRASQPPQTPPPSELPHALRAFRELILKMSSTGDLTTLGSNLILHTLGTLFEGDFLRCGPDANPAHRLPLTLETLKRHECDPADLLDFFAVCPDFECQVLKRVADLDPDRPTHCEKCGKRITRVKIRRRHGRKPRYRHVPILKYTECPIEEQTRQILSRPEIMEAIRAHREHLRREGKPPGTLEDIQDAKLWSNFEKDGSKFFENPDNIGYILMCDWFQPSTRRGAPSYSTGVISLCIANLPPHLRVRPENKILVGVIPGPHEPNVDTIHHFLKPMVNELKSLWKDGMEFIDRDGSVRVIQAALIAIVCDTPAARKVGGFPRIGATYPCTVCWCSHHKLHMCNQAFERRSRREQKKAARAYKDLKNNNQRSNFIASKYKEGKPGGYRWSELLRLPYWDPTTMIVVNAMHCLFLGLVDWQFHNVWIDMKHLRPGKELDVLQKMVQSTIRPKHCGKPPYGLGTSGAGSLTADPLHSLVSIDLPLAIPLIWDTVDPTSAGQRAQEVLAKRREAAEKRKAEGKKGDKITRAATKARQRAEAANQAAGPSEKRQRGSATTGRQPKRKRDESSEREVTPEDAHVMANALKATEDDARERGLLSWRKQDAKGQLLLSSAIKYLTPRTVTIEGIKKGEEYLKRYLAQTAEFRGAERIVPNHHISTHVPEQLLNYGPTAGLWAYSGERLNYDMKQTNNNRHGGGEREMTFAAAFHRRRFALARIATSQEDPLLEWAQYLRAQYHSDVRGTAAAEAADDQADEDAANKHPQKKSFKLSSQRVKELADVLKRIRPDLPFRLNAFEQADYPLLSAKVPSIRKITQNGREYSISVIGNSIIQADTVENGQRVVRVGELVDIWEHRYIAPDLKTTNNTFALVRWYKRLPIFAPRSARLWFEQFPHLDIDIHPAREYIDPPAIISVNDICCHCARMSTDLDGKPVWLTITVERE